MWAWRSVKFTVTLWLPLMFCSCVLFNNTGFSYQYSFFSYFYAEIQLYKCLLGIFFEDRTITQSKNHCSLEKKQTQKLNTKSKLSSPVQQQQKYIIFYFLHKGVSPGQSQYHDETPQQRVLAFSAAITSLASGETTVQQVI